MNAEGNATLFNGEATIDLRDPTSTSSLDRLHQYITDPIYVRSLQWTRHIKLNLYPELSEKSGRKHCAATLDAVIKALHGGSRLKLLVINIHFSDRRTKEQVVRFIMLLQDFRVNGAVIINQFVYGPEDIMAVWRQPRRLSWACKLMKAMRDKREASFNVKVTDDVSGGAEVPEYNIFHGSYWGLINCF